MTTFSEDFTNLYNSLSTLQKHLDVEFNNIYERISELEYRQSQDDDFYENLETLIRKRNTR